MIRTNKTSWFLAVSLGDAQNDIFSLWSRTIRAAFMGLPEARFIVHAGDLVFQGHDHVWVRLCDACPGDDGYLGPVYITSVSGLKMYRLDGRHWHDRAGENTQLFQVFSISGNRPRYQSIAVTGEVYDAFDLVKDEKTLLIENTHPNVPVYRFSE